MSGIQYNFAILPHDDHSVRQWAPKFIEFRLDALKAAPASFSSSHEKEARISKAEWISLLCEPAYRVVVGVIRTDDHRALPVWESEWVLISNLYGPRCHHQPYHDNATDCQESSWYLAASFVSPLHRQGGILREAYFACERAAVSEDKDLFQKRQHAQPLRLSGHRSNQFRTRILATIQSKAPALLNYYRSGGLEISHTLIVGDLARWGWEIALNPDRLDKEVIVLEKIIAWEAEPLGRL
ncbi:hypothetical protein N7448_005741 [Penicillium atrosanguineum]|nr:hypothetical protein N7448_005741 [Penicillium atrosanguineum]